MNTDIVNVIPRSDIERLLDDKPITYQIMSDKYFVPVDSQIIIRCARNHTYTTIMQYGFDCDICRLLTNMHKTDNNIVCVQSDYLMGQKQFRFVCSKKHNFFVRTDQTVNSCLSCKSLDLARIRHKVVKPSELILDITCVNKNKHSRLRFHCNKTYHNPMCDNPACVILRNNKHSTRDFVFGCMNTATCDQDFYASLDDLYSDDIYFCRNNHIKAGRGPVIAVLRCFEILFGKRFDDSTCDDNFAGDSPHDALSAEFTCYNANMRIACTHILDKQANNALSQSKTYAQKYNILLIIVPENHIKSSAIVNYIVRALHSCGKINTPIEQTVQDIRITMKVGNRKKKLFDDKCCLY